MKARFVGIILLSAGLAALTVMVGCSSKKSAPTPVASAVNPVLQNDYGGSGAAISTPIASAFVLFQNDATSRLINLDGGAVQQNGVNNIYSFGVYADPNAGNRLKLFVNDRANHRVLIFNSVPRNAGAQPDVVVGQVNFTAGVANAGAGPAGTPSALGFNENVHVGVCSNGKMFVSDRQNNRVLVYNSVPTVNGAAADFVIGQPDFATSTQVNPPTASSLFRPYGAYCIADKLFVVDKDNNRILVFNPIPIAGAPAASYVVGQADMITSAPGCAADRFNSPYEILRVGDRLYVADGGNHRVLEFAAIPGASGASAGVVLGQADMTTSCLHNKTATATPSDSSLWFPNALAVKGNSLAVSDHSNNRIMFFTLPLSTNQSAYAQHGQPDFVTSTVVDPPTANSVGSTKGMIFDANYLWISDGRNHRVVLAPLP